MSGTAPRNHSMRVPRPSAQRCYVAYVILKGTWSRLASWQFERGRIVGWVSTKKNTRTGCGIDSIPLKESSWFETFSRIYLKLELRRNTVHVVPGFLRRHCHTQMLITRIRVTINGITTASSVGRKFVPNISAQMSLTKNINIFFETITAVSVN